MVGFYYRGIYQMVLHLEYELWLETFTKEWMFVMQKGVYNKNDSDTYIYLPLRCIQIFWVHKHLTFGTLAISCPSFIKSVIASITWHNGEDKNDWIILRNIAGEPKISEQ